MDEETISRKIRWAWLAGIIDGEGSLEANWCFRHNISKKTGERLTTKGFYCRIKIDNTDPRMIEKTSRIYVENKIGFYYRTFKDDRPNRKWTISIIVQGKGNCKKVLLGILPYIYNKRDQVNKFLELIEYRGSLGYKGGFKKIQGSRWTGWNIDPNWKPLDQDETLIKLVQELLNLKHNPPSPSETIREANKVLILR